VYFFNFYNFTCESKCSCTIMYACEKSPPPHKLSYIGLFIFFHLNLSHIKILYIKATVFVCLCGQCLEDSSSHCPFPMVFVCLWWQTGQGKAGQGGQGSRYGRPDEVPFLLKKSLGKTGGPTSNQTKIQF
jgi:hypothetical protein